MNDNAGLFNYITRTVNRLICHWKPNAYIPLRETLFSSLNGNNLHISRINRLSVHRGKHVWHPYPPPK